jgi:phage gpG-like protein
MLTFGYFGQAAQHLLSLKLGQQHTAMEAACVLVENEAKGLIGNYQSAFSPFAAWPELAQATKDQRVSLGYSENDPLLREGDLRDSIDHLSAHTIGVVGSAEDVAVYQELGTAKIPPRSFLGLAAHLKAHDIASLLGHGVVGTLVGNQAHLLRFTP